MDKRVAAALAALLILAIVAVVLAFRFVAAERERELRAWEVRLGIVAESRFADVSQWLTSQFNVLRNLAENESVQLYITQITGAGSDEDALVMADAARQYLQNLLVARAELAGFTAPPSSVPANVERPAVGGIALLDMQLEPLAVTPGMPPRDGMLATFLDGLTAGSPDLLDIHLNHRQQPAMGFAVPIYAVQGEHTAADQVGWAIAVKEIADELYPLLRQPGETSQTAVALLVRSAGNQIEYLSPLPDGTPALSFTIAGTPQLDAVFAMVNPGVFSADHVDYRSRPVLLTSRNFTAAPWTLLYEVQRSEALAESESRLRGILIGLLLAIALIAALIIAVWRHASSRRAREAALRAEQTAARLQDQRNLLRLVTDSQPTSISILDTEGRYLFANKQAAQGTGLQPEELTGKTMAAVVGPHAAKRYIELNERALREGHVVSDVERVETPAGERIIQSEHIPIEPTSEMPRAVLAVENDITAAVRERERRARTLDRLVRTLVSVVDRRDPYAARHSARVAQIARAVAEEMGLSTTEVETAEIAGSLLNLGKILVEKDVLTRSGQLSEDERQQIRRSVLAGAELLEGIEFDGPVVETLRQAQAHWDGSGLPAGLSGEEILVTARIIAVANAFVGMTSRRAHREALDIDQAVEALLQGVGKEFDRRVVAALINWLDNRGGREQVAAAAAAESDRGIEQPLQPQ